MPGEKQYTYMKGNTMWHFQKPLMSDFNQYSTIFQNSFQIFWYSNKSPKLLDFMALCEKSFLLQLVFETDYLGRKL